MESKPNPPKRISWYRSPVGREELNKLNQRSDFLGFLQTGGYLGLLAVTGTAAYLSIGRLHWVLVILIFYFHGTCYNFLINGFHELVHDSVFKTKVPNRVFLWVHSFLGWYNHIHFWASHTEHHKYTLHQPDDLEVVLPRTYSRMGFLSVALIDPVECANRILATIRLSFGKLSGEWEHHLFNDVYPQRRQALFNWSRILLLGHAAIIGISIWQEMWWLPVVVTLAPFYGRGIQFLCNYTQHTGLKDDEPDYRLCCRTIYLNPFFQFLYWHMNYHTEHHMYAAVPCYNLGKLHRLIKDDLPHCPNGLYETWTQIGRIIERQKVEPDYQYVPELPPRKEEPGEENAPVDEVSCTQTAT
jgi:fatty acid desaturase